MHRQWPFFRTLLSTLDMVLAKTNRASRITISGLAAGSRKTG
jgi:phosphoenolpyruvate carboxylase